MFAKETQKRSGGPDGSSQLCLLGGGNPCKIWEVLFGSKFAQTYLKLNENLPLV